MIANIHLMGAPPLAAFSTGVEILAILWITACVIVCCAFPLTAGIARGHVALGIICAMITLPIAALSQCWGGLPVGFGFSILISLMPVRKNKPLLSQAEIEKEMQRARGY